MSPAGLDDQRHEALIAALYEAVAPLREHCGEEDEEIESIEDAVVSTLETIMARMYSEGHADGAADEKVGRELQGQVPKAHLNELESIIQNLKPISEKEDE